MLSIAVIPRHPSHPRQSEPGHSASSESSESTRATSVQPLPPARDNNKAWRERAPRRASYHRAVPLLRCTCCLLRCTCCRALVALHVLQGPCCAARAAGPLLRCTCCLLRCPPVAICTRATAVPSGLGPPGPRRAPAAHPMAQGMPQQPTPWPQSPGRWGAAVTSALLCCQQGAAVTSSLRPKSPCSAAVACRQRAGRHGRHVQL
jgi:hypothetical protein